MTDGTEVTEETGEDAEGNVLQAIAGPGNHYAMIILSFDEEGAMSIRLPSNLNTPSVKALLIRTADML